MLQRLRATLAFRQMGGRRVCPGLGSVGGVDWQPLDQPACEQQAGQRQALTNRSWQARAHQGATGCWLQKVKASTKPDSIINDEAVWPGE